MEELQAVIKWSLGFQDNSPSLSYDMTILLRDALINFVAVREEGDAELYVEKDYPELEGKEKDDKIAEVSKRCQLAKDMEMGLKHDSARIPATEEACGICKGNLLEEHFDERPVVNNVRVCPLCKYSRNLNILEDQDIRILSEISERYKESGWEMSAERANDPEAREYNRRIGSRLVQLAEALENILQEFAPDDSL
jgi:hypothetical protein